MPGTQLNGVIRSISDPEFLTNDFVKRNFVLTVDHGKQYPQHMKLELHGDRIDLIEPYEVGQEVSVDFNFRGKECVKEGETVTINTLLVWKIQPVNQKKNG